MDVVINDEFWYEDPSVLLKKERLIEFIPLENHTYEEWLNSTVRFSMYISVLFYIFEREYVLFMIPFIAGCLTYFFYYRNKEYYDKNDDEQYPCQRPTKDNPMMNLTIADYGYNTNKKKACDINHVKDDVKKYLNRTRYTNAFDVLTDDVREREYYTMPNTENPNNQHDFANWLYKTDDTCKTNIRNCNVPHDIRSDRDWVTRNYISGF